MDPCSEEQQQDLCQERIENNNEAYYRSDIPGSMMMPIYECDISKAECCTADGTTCYQGNVGNFAVNATSAHDV